jgi:hypothetical protein
VAVSDLGSAGYQALERIVDHFLKNQRGCTETEFRKQAIFIKRSADFVYYWVEYWFVPVFVMNVFILIP